MSKKNIFIALATSILGGPGKGLEQFLRNGGLDGCNPYVVDYILEKNKSDSEFARTIHSTGAPILPLFQKKTFDLDLVNQGLRIIQEKDIQILQSHGYKSHLLCWLLHRKTKLPWIAFVHGWTHENLKIRLYILLERVLLLGATEIVAVSESLRSRLLYPVRKRTKVITNALASEELIITRERAEIRQELGISDDTSLICIVGRLSPEKNHTMFLKGIAKGIKKGVKVHALLIGDGQEYENLQSLIKELKIENNTTFLGHVRDTANYYNASDIQVMTSTTEGMPNVALEGMYMGLPLIATNVGGIPEVVIDKVTGILIPSGDSDALTNSLITLINDSNLRKEYGKAGKERIEKHFNPSVRASKILSLYDAVISKQKQ